MFGRGRVLASMAERFRRARTARRLILLATLAAATFGAAASASGGPPTVSVVSGATLSAVWEKGCDESVPVGAECSFRDVALQVSPLQGGGYRTCLFTAEGIQRSLPEDFDQIERSGCLDGVAPRVAKNGSSATLAPTSIQTCTAWDSDCRVETITRDRSITVGAVWRASGPAERANLLGGGGPCISHTNAIVRPATMSATFDGQVLAGIGDIARVLSRRVDCNPGGPEE